MKNHDVVAKLAEVGLGLVDKDAQPISIDRGVVFFANQSDEWAEIDLTEGEVLPNTEIVLGMATL